MLSRFYVYLEKQNWYSKARTIEQTLMFRRNCQRYSGEFQVGAGAVWKNSRTRIGAGATLKPGPLRFSWYTWIFLNLHNGALASKSIELWIKKKLFEIIAFIIHKFNKHYAKSLTQLSPVKNYGAIQPQPLSFVPNLCHCSICIRLLGLSQVLTDFTQHVIYLFK